jgi:hypothetical protein
MEEEKEPLKLFDHFPQDQIGEITRQMLEDGDWVEKRNEELEKTQKPKIARACPVRVTLKKGETYLYCTCGESKF